MKKIFTFTALLIACTSQAFAQQNCVTPLLITLCPATVLNGQTNLGMANDFINPCNLAGEDLVYKMTTAPNTSRIYISFSSVSAPLRATFTTNCSINVCSYIAVTGNVCLPFNVLGNTTYFLWIDANTTVTYNIGFGNDTSSTWVNIPNTQGNLNFESTVCAVPPFKSTKPFLQLIYNGIYKTDPMTLSPLNVPGTFCLITYFRNTTGIESIRRFEFYYNPLGFSNFTPSTLSFPGFYNPGTWVGAWVVNRWVFTFNDLAGLGKGDFTGTPNTCLRYEFCFDVTPISNDPVNTNVLDSAFSDGFGMGFSGFVNSGCYAPGFSCGGGGPGSGATSGHAFGTSANDPAGPLPIVLLQFNVKPKNENVEVEWTTSSELNNDYFTIEKSIDGFEWITAYKTDGAGNSTSPLSYFYIDPNPYPGISYYRLKQTDFDGTATYSGVAAVKMKKSIQLTVYPNPSHGDVIVSSPEEPFNDELLQGLKFTITNIMGQSIVIPYSEINGEIHLDLSILTKGIYILEINQDEIKSHHRIILPD